MTLSQGTSGSERQSCLNLILVCKGDSDVKKHGFRKKRLREDEVAQIPGSLCGGCKEQQPASYNEAVSDTPASPGAMGLGVLPLSIGVEE